MGGESLDAPVRVAIVDDHPVVVDGIRSWLQADPRLTVVFAGADPAGALDPPGGPPDVVLLDLNLDGRPTLEHAEALAQGGQRVIVFSQHAAPELVLEALDAGACEFITKDESRDHLVAAVLAVSADRPYVAPTEAGALLGDDGPHRPSLSAQEKRALRLWFQGMSKDSVAKRMEISVHTVDMYIKRARVKYAQVGRRAPTKSDLLARAFEDGLVQPEDVGNYQSRATRP